MDAITLKTKDLAERFNERLQQLKSLSRPNRNTVEGEAEGALPPSASKELKLLFETMKINSDERKRIYAIVEDLNKEVTDAENRKAKAEKKVHKTYNKLDMLEKGVKEIERKLQITSTDGKQEKEMIKEMQFIRDSRPYLEEIAGLNQIIFQKKKEKYEISQPIGPLKEEAKELQTKIDSFKKTQEVAKESKETIQKALDKINQERNTLRGQNEDLWQQKLKLREDYYKKVLAYERQQIEIRDIEWMTGIKERVIQREEEKKQWEEEKARRQEERK
jgi:chromosome segregation ATPase